MLARAAFCRARRANPFVEDEDVEKDDILFNIA